MKKSLLALFMLCAVIPLFAQEHERELTVMTYNIFSGQRSSLERLAEEIKAADPDFVAIQELDVNTMREVAKGHNRVNCLNRLAELTGMFGFYGRTCDYWDGWYGIGLLSKHPMVSVRKFDLPNPKDVEPRILLIGQFEIDGSADHITFVSTHFDYIDAETIAIQAQAASDELRKLDGPVLIAGDLNCDPTSKAISILKKDFKDLTCPDNTFPAWDSEAKIDWILGYPAAEFTLIDSTVPSPSQQAASDHLPVVSKIKVRFK